MTQPKEKLSKFEETVLAYKYSSPNLSMFETLFLNRFWDHFVNVYPLWLAPNLITCIGGMCCIVMYHLNWYFSPLGAGQAPQWMYCLFAFLLWSYQTLDGTDGKQARRTKSGSALGELMDHGVDAVITGFAAFVVTDALALGIDRPVVWMSIVGGQMAFYMSNLTLLHRGKQTFFPVDIMELQWVMISVMMVSGLFGPQIWQTTTFPVPVNEAIPFVEFIAKVLDVPEFVSEGRFQARFVIAVGAVGGTVMNFFLYSYMSSTPYLFNTALNHPGTGVFQLGKQIVIILLYGVLCACCYVFVMRIQFDAYVRHDAFRAFLMMSCFAFGDLMDRLLVMRVTHMEFRFLSPTLGVVSLFAMFAQLGLQVKGLPVFWVVAFVSLGAHIAFFSWVSKKLARVLGISVFTIKKVALN